MEQERVGGAEQVPATTETSAGTDKPTYEGLKKKALEVWNEGEDRLWQFGFILNQIDSLSLYKPKFKTARQAFAADFEIIPAATLTLCLKIARKFPEPTSLQFGMSKLMLLIRANEMAGGDDLPADPSDVLVLVPPLPDKAATVGPPVEKRFADCSVADMQRSVVHHKGQKLIPPQETAVVERVNKGLEEKLGGSHGFTLKPKWKGKNVVLTMEGPPDLFEHLVGALGRSGPVKPYEPPARSAGGFAEKLQTPEQVDEMVRNLGESMNKLKDLPKPPAPKDDEKKK
jgi:hypothetical protein